LHFSVLASGSKGNSAVVHHEGAAILIDAGIGPRRLLERLGRAGLPIQAVAGVVLTHTHGDHAHDDSLRLLATHRIPFYCHADHVADLENRPGFQALALGGLVRNYDERAFLALGGLWFEPVELSHSGPTYGFRIEGRERRGRRGTTLGYLTDSGSWTQSIVSALADIDLLAIESNHDVELTRESKRHPSLIARNLGPNGHLSNEQAAALIEAVVLGSRRGSPKRIVLLHLSEDCNRPELALAAARAALRRCGRRVDLRAACFHEVIPHLPVGAPASIHSAFDRSPIPSIGRRPNSPGSLATPPFAGRADEPSARPTLPFFSLI
jgi:phosphoribosyl 1,2-cyclic phosphodiesterase